MLVLCIVLVGLASSALAADLSRGAMNVGDKYADSLTADSPSIYGVRHAPLEAFLRESVKSAVSVVFLPPASYDLRTLGRLTPVKDQGNYGTCWTFATYGSMESCLLPGEARDFSENNLAWNAGYDWGFDDGGNYTMSTAYLARWDGPINEADDPYGSGAHDPSALTKQKHVQDVLVLAPKSGASCDDIKNALMTHGAVATYMYADFGYSYYDSSTRAFYYPGSEDSDHAVTIVGWDDNYSASNFATTPPGNGAFIVRNSWGAGWGEAGYFYASYYDTWVGVDAWCFSGSEATNNYTSNYGHDPLGCTTFYGWTDETTLWLANAFTATSTQSITAASVHTAYSGIAYEVWAGATKSTMTQRGTGVFTDAGYHTVDLNTPLAVTNGQSFAVGFKVTGGTGEEYLACCEYPFDGWSSGATAAPGQSFVSFDGSTWYDFSTDVDTNTNLCVKAFAGGSAPTPDPVLTSVNPNHGTVGSTVVLMGTDLGTSGTVYFGATSATTSSWGATAIVATVPNGLSPGAVSVTVATGGKTSNALVFTVTGGGGSAPTMSFTCPHDLTKWHNHDLPVTFTVTDPDGDADVLLYSGNGTDWYEMDLAIYDTLNFPAEADHSWDGATLIYCKARDLALHESAEQQFTVRIDTRKPTAKALYAVTVRKGRTATLKYRIVDAAPNGGTATGVKIQIKNRYGKVVKTFRLGTKKVNTAYSVRFTCKLAKGTYRFYVSGKDVAGNTAKVGSNRLTVR